ncbi:histone-lysine N-methyltransferase SETDB1-B-like isoform X2 [Eleginops maclovinus]|uniref:histone-lysine N-methyltransferase SETDB1-B-like isoform X2 n=1 Tax=Eleginops maclovinus TaxID=56733 RepID=UPI0030808467
MEVDEIVVSRNELQKLVKQKVKENKLIASDVLEKCILIQSLLDRKEQQAVELLKLCKSVSAFEAIVKKQYSLLGWEYRDTDSDDNVDCDGDDNIPSCETSISRRREPVVVLTRLSEAQLKSLCAPTHQDHHSKYKYSNNSDSDIHWEPRHVSSDSDYSTSSKKTVSKKRRKGVHKNQKLSQRNSQDSTITGSTSNKGNISRPQSRANTEVESAVTKTSTPAAETKGLCPLPKVTTLCQKSDKVTKTSPSAPLEVIKVTMRVVARRTTMNWQQGEIINKVQKEDGRLKYKIQFNDKGKSLVSAHHIAFDYMPEVDKLFVGARVVVKHQTDGCLFCPGILAELPSRKNHMRFLVFMDDHTPLYVNLPSLHLVCRPLTDPLDDIPDGRHKSFVQQYLKVWPYPPQMQYRVGQEINAVLKGIMHRCTVKLIDSSLFQVLVLINVRNGSTKARHAWNSKCVLLSRQKSRQRRKHLLEPLNPQR